MKREVVRAVLDLVGAGLDLWDEIEDRRAAKRLERARAERERLAQFVHAAEQGARDGARSFSGR